MPSEAFAVRLYSAFQSGSPAAVYDNLVRVGAIDSAYRSFCVSGRHFVVGFVIENLSPVLRGKLSNSQILFLVPKYAEIEDLSSVLEPLCQELWALNDGVDFSPRDRQIFGILGPSSFDYEATAQLGRHQGACATFPCIQCKEGKDSPLFKIPTPPPQENDPPRTFLDQRAHCRLLAHWSRRCVASTEDPPPQGAWIISGRARFDALAHLPTIFFPARQRPPPCLGGQGDFESGKLARPHSAKNCGVPEGETHFFYHPGMNTAAKFLRFIGLWPAVAHWLGADLELQTNSAEFSWTWSTFQARLLHSYGEAFDTVPLKAHLLWHVTYRRSQVIRFGGAKPKLSQPKAIAAGDGFGATPATARDLLAGLDEDLIRACASDTILSEGKLVRPIVRAGTRILGMLYELAPPRPDVGMGLPAIATTPEVPSFCLIQGPGERVELLPVDLEESLEPALPQPRQDRHLFPDARFVWLDAASESPNVQQHPLDMLPTSAEFEPSTGLYWHRFSLSCEITPTTSFGPSVTGRRSPRNIRSCPVTTPRCCRAVWNASEGPRPKLANASANDFGTAKHWLG
ncbi:hypothetical protein PAPYR_9118 [Paratrimastix pyriformis]|uniref:Uncharacterized protein n=1 Tax=Paratrimastix pyriformis TaxID=342808 RepID=A0ABQ8UEQ2_9EUKA|nr:hypothetical protein PAPYR_9118 [Paratrimastix pyriformis]